MSNGKNQAAITAAAGLGVPAIAGALGGVWGLAAVGCFSWLFLVALVLRHFWHASEHRVVLRSDKEWRQFMIYLENKKAETAAKIANRG